uniref:Nonstructural polyprotein n=1 Tax=Chipolycivirus sp. TaxID=2809300 RepID=A0AAU8JNI0_9VIRU
MPTYNEYLRTPYGKIFCEKRNLIWQDDDSIRALVRSFETNYIPRIKNYEDEFGLTSTPEVYLFPATHFDKSDPNYMVWEYYTSKPSLSFKQGEHLLILSVDDEDENKVDMMLPVLHFLNLVCSPSYLCQLPLRAYMTEFSVMIISSVIADMLILLLHRFNNVYSSSLDYKLFENDSDILTAYAEVKPKLIYKKKYEEFNMYDLVVCEDPDIEQMLLNMSHPDLRNPGPIVVDKSLGKQLLDGGLLITLPNGRNFLFKEDDYSVSDEYMIHKYTQDFSDEMKGVIRMRTLQDKKCNVEIDVGIDMSFSNHRNFDINKRVVLKFQSAFISGFNGELPEETEGVYTRVENFSFVPRNLIRFVYRRNHYTIQKDVLTMALDVLQSVERQELTAVQLMQTAIRISQIQMMAMDLEHDFKKYIGVFADLLATNACTLNQNRKMQISFSDVWDYVRSIKVVIPTKSVWYGSTLELFTYQPPMKNLSKIPDQDEIANYHEGLPKYDFDSKSMTELVADFASGKMRVTKSKNIFMKFDFSTEKVPYTLRSEDGDLSSLEQFFVRLIKNRIVNSNLDSCFLNSIAEVTELTLARKLFRTYSEKVFSVRVGANLVKMMIKDQSKPEIPDIDTLLEHDIMRNPDLTLEKQIAQRAQLEFQIFTSEFGSYSKKNVFNNVNMVRYIYHLRRSLAKDAVLDNFKATIHEAYTSAKEAFLEVTKAKDTMKEVNEMWTKNRTKVQKLLTLSDGNAAFFQDLDFSTFSSSIQSAKDMLNGVFRVMVKKTLGMLGLDEESIAEDELCKGLDLTTALFYYIVWINTESSYLKYLLIIDICTKLNIVDIVLAAIRKIWKTVSNFNVNSMWQNRGSASTSRAKPDSSNPTISPEKPIDARDLQNVFDDLDNRIKETTDKAKTRLPPEEEEILNLEKPDSDFITTIMHYLEVGTPAILGVSAIALLASFGMSTKGMKCNIIGNDIVTTCRNLSFISAGVAAIPKIYSNVSKVLYWVFDHIKKVIYKDHQTKFEFTNHVVKWIESAAIFGPSSGYLIVKSPELCLLYLRLHAEMTKINSRLLELDNTVVITYIGVRRRFEMQYELVRGTMAAMFPLQEIFHVMITGEPGVGKTDLADIVLGCIKDAYLQQEITNSVTIPNERCRGAVLDSIVKSSAFGDIYNMSESAKFMDNYFGQPVLRVDEVDSFASLEPETYIKRLMLLSGAPVGSDQAALENKGRMITSKMMVSNTNNPYLKPDNMKSPEALHRRRLLIRASFRPELEAKLKKETGDANVAIDDFCKKHRLNRTKSEHLVIDILHNTQHKILKEGGVPMAGLSVQQAMKYISLKCQLHYAKEWDRALVKDPVRAVLAMYFDAEMILQENELISGLQMKSLKKDLHDKLSNYTHLHEQALTERYTKALVSAKTEEEKKDLTSHITSFITRKAKMARSLLDHLVENDLDSTTVEEHIEDLAEGSDCAGKVKTANYDLTHTQQGYAIVPSAEERAYTTEPINFNHISEVEINTRTRFVYTAKITNDIEAMAVLGELIYLNEVPLFGARARVAKRKRSYSQMSIIQKWKNEIKLYLSSIMHVSKSILSYVTDFIIHQLGARVVKGICIAAALFATIFAISATASLFVPTDSLAYSTQRKNAQMKIPGMNAVRDTGLATKFSKNVVKIYNPENEIYFTAFGYRGNLFLTDTHNVASIKRNTTIYVANMNNKMPAKSMPFGPRSITLIDGDVSLICLPDYHAIADISRHWATDHDLENDMMNLRLAKASPILLRDDRIVIDPKRPAQREIIIPQMANIIEPGVFLNTGLHPRHRTRMFGTIVEVGDSGSPVFHDNTRMGGTLFGLVHRKFDPNCMVAVVSREQIEDAVKRFDAKYSIKVQLAQTDLIMDQPINAVFKYDQTIKSSLYPNQAISTQPGFKPTPIFQHFPVESYPAIQHDRDARIPKDARHHMEVSLNKGSGFSYPKFTFEQEEFAKSFLESMYLKYHPEVLNMITYNTVQAITGIPMPGSTRMELNSCAGLPYKLTAKKGKDPYIRTGPSGETLIANSVFVDVENYEDHYIYNEVPYNTKLEFRKIELVGMDKITNPKTRTVGQGNLIHQIVYNKLFKDMFTIVKMVWNEGRASPFALGMDVERHWDQVAKHLKYDDYVIEIDVKAWDANISLRTLFMAAEVKLRLLKKAHIAQNKAYNPKYDKIAYGLCVDFAVADVCYENIMYEKHAGLLSGHPGTFMENSEIHEMILAVACKSILDREAPQYANATFMHEHIRSIKAADDILIAVSPLARKYITAESIKEAYEEIGLQVTSAKKTDKIEAQPLDQTQFLKTGFKKIDGTYYPVPNRSIIHQLLNYVRTDSKLGAQEQISTNFANALRFAFWLGPNEYEEYRQKINLLSARNKIQFHWDFNYQYMGAWIKHQALLRANQENRTEPLEESEYYRENLERGYFNVDNQC